jgi:hypothetical protein
MTPQLPRTQESPLVSSWRVCYAEETFTNEVNARWPHRDKASDGSIGNAEHAARSSDHNPWIKVAGQGVVRAKDIDVDGVDMGWLAEFMRKRGAAGDPRLAGGGYVIFNRRITKPDFSGWKAYNGTNPHTHHGHFSFSKNQSGFDSRAPWGISGAPAFSAPSAPSRPAPPGSRHATIQRGDNGADVKLVQRFLGVAGPGGAGYGHFGPLTETKVKRYQANHALSADGIVGPKTWAKMEL